MTSCAGIKSCQALLRLINELQRCHDLNPANIDNLLDIDDINDLLNDYIHLVTEHKQDLQSIREELRKTQVLPNCSDDCQQVMRHYGDDQALKLYIEVMDSLHNYLLHPLGLETRRDPVDRDAETKKHTSTKFDLFPATDNATKGILSKMYASLWSMHVQNSARGTSPGKVPVGNPGLNCAHAPQTSIHIIVCSQPETHVLLVGATWMDTVMQEIRDLTIKHTRSELADELEHFLETELYDSDALRMDVCVKESILSNVGLFVGDTLFLRCRHLCWDCRRAATRMSPCFWIYVH